MDDVLETPIASSPVMESAVTDQAKNVETNSNEEFSFLAPGKGAKADVLFSSVSVFAQKGIDDTTVQDLLDAANVSRRTFYKYFSNKVDVLETIYKTAEERLIARFRGEKDSAASVQEFVTRCVDIYFDYHTSLGALVRIMTEEARRSGSPLAAHRETLIDELVLMFHAKHRETEGLDVDPQLYYVIIWAMESASMHILTKTPETTAEVDRWKLVMRSLIARAVSDDGSARPELPLAPNNA